VTTARDEKGRPTVFDALPAELGRVVSVGRLDLNSEGLLLLTNDGALKRRLELPATGWLRKYRVRVHGHPDAAALAPLEAGMTVDGERFRPIQARIDRQQGANAWLTLGLREGRNREIRRALAALGFPVTRLIRIAYGPFQLGELPPGAVAPVPRGCCAISLAKPAARVRNRNENAPQAPRQAGLSPVYRRRGARGPLQACQPSSFRSPPIWCC
jgi:23S rRNA pseudouridine2605 synthase